MSSQAFAADLFQENEAYQHAAILLYDTVAGSRQAESCGRVVKYEGVCTIHRVPEILVAQH